MTEIIYMDNAASTRMDERVLEAMKPYMFESYAVATSEFGHSMGINARESLDEARNAIAKHISAEGEELTFTSGDTESCNMAIKGVVQALAKKKGQHMIVSKIEDFSVLNTAKALERDGFNVTYLKVDGEGFVDLEELKSAIRPETVLVSVQHANQEIGTIQDIKAIGEICHEAKALLHSDATHTFTRTPLDMGKMPVDLLTLTAHTIHGPKGVGALYVRKGTPIGKWMDGGYQESNRRAGLENIPSIVGMAKAAELVTEEENDRLRGIRDKIMKNMLAEIKYTELNGSRTKRIPQNANVTFHQVEGESMTLHLDMRGIEVSTGSACFSRSLEASHVIMGIGGGHERAHGSIRFSLGRYNSIEEVDPLTEAMKDIVTRLREISPLKR